MALIFSVACSHAKEGSRTASVASSWATPEFADKLCDSVIDSLQSGRHHWMACHSKSDELLQAPITEADFVNTICASIQDSFVAETSLGACLEGGKGLIRAHSESAEQKAYFQRTASSIVACYERTGDVLSNYDEVGACSDDSELSAWTLQSTLSVTSELQNFESLDSRVAIVGDYQGAVEFFNANDRRCTFDLSFSYSGEDILVDTAKFLCR